MRYLMLDDGRKPPFPERVTDTILLQPLAWNDWWQFKTSYYAYYVDQEGTRADLGGVKIGNIEFPYVKDKATSGDRAPLDSEFLRLSRNFISVGQDESYYSNLLSALGPRAAIVLSELNDLAADPELYKQVRSKPVVYESLLRNVPLTSLTGVFKRIIDGAETPATYDFTFTRPTPGPAWLAGPLELSFAVTPNSTPPTNVHVLIGRNGSGKTTLLSAITRSMLGIAQKDDGVLHSAHGGRPEIANVVHIGFSAFDVVDVPVRDDPLSYDVAYSYVGLHYVGAKRALAEENKEKEDLGSAKRTRPASELGGDFARSAWRVISEKSRDLWRSSLKNLESDPNFEDAQISSLADYSLDDERSFRERAGDMFQKLSSGHKIVLLSVTRLVETVTEQSLVLIDEPEGHLHPPLLSAFVRTLSDLMQKRNGIAIIATHSPVILQEVPRECAWRINRAGGIQTADRPAIETFGENVGTLTNTVFGLEVTDSGFHRMLREAALELGSYEAVVGRYKEELGFEARALLRTWFNSQAVK